MTCTRKDCKGTAWEVYDTGDGLEIERCDAEGILASDELAQAHALRYHEREIPDECIIWQKVAGTDLDEKEMPWVNFGSLKEIRRITGIPFDILVDKSLRVEVLQKSDKLSLLIGLDPQLDVELEELFKNRLRKVA